MVASREAVQEASGAVYTLGTYYYPSLLNQGLAGFVLFPPVALIKWVGCTRVKVAQRQPVSPSHRLNWPAATAHCLMGAASSMAAPKATGQPPVDDGGAKHLIGHPLPSLTYLPSTTGDEVDLFNVSLTRPVLVFIYPRVFLGETPREWTQISGMLPWLLHTA